MATCEGGATRVRVRLTGYEKVGASRMASETVASTSAAPLVGYVGIHAGNGQNSSSWYRFSGKSRRKEPSPAQVTPSEAL